jgi:hypothetical protein
MNARQRLVLGLRAMAVTVPFVALAALPWLVDLAPRTPVAVAVPATLSMAVPATGPSTVTAARWQREHAITREQPLRLYWGCRGGPSGCRFTDGKLEAESLATVPLNLTTDSLGLDTFLIHAPPGHTLDVVSASGVDCRTIAGEPNGVLCELTGPAAALTLVVTH